jgi:carbon monoxide dehydrogenase subunit G
VQVKGQTQLPAPRSQVWATLMSPDALRQALPGCQKFEAVGPDEWEATMSVGLAAIKGTYSGRVKLSDREAEQRYRLSVEGSGGGSRIRGSGVITLADAPPGADAPQGATLVSYEGEAQVMGTLAAVGQRLMQPAAKMLADQFFGRVGAQVGAQHQAGEPAPTGAEHKEEP